MEKNSRMSNLGEKSEYEKIINEYDNLFGMDIGSMSINSLNSSVKTNKNINFVNGELIIKKR